MNSTNRADDHDAYRLALTGGPPVFPEGPPAWPPADEDILFALQSAYEDGSWGRYHGPNIDYLVDELARRHEVPHVMGVCSGTIAVELALRGVRVGAGEEVILAGYDFPGNFRAIEAVGSVPVLVDISPTTWTLDMDRLDDAYSPRVRAVIVSHLHGGLAPMREICEWAAERKIAVIEDACQAPGAEVQGKPAGAWGDVRVLSFGGSKLLTAGRGGAVLTRHPEVLQRIRIYNERGNEALPLSELQAAVLRPQLAKLDGRNRQRRSVAARLLERLRDTEGLTPVSIDRSRGEPALYKLAWLYDAAVCGGHSRAEFIAAIRAEGVALDEGFRGFSRRSSRRCRQAGPQNASRAAADETVLLHHPILLQGLDAADRVARAFQKVLRVFRS
ncbi:MAG: aminotransferase class V-fold PLP-dependent enzyme [Planctomycetes bacterium]|nr:aminotransferase class V-fold PLP-dependent enzyme [Planctomycetota bacterium]